MLCKENLPPGTAVADISRLKDRIAEESNELFSVLQSWKYLSAGVGVDGMLVIRSIHGCHRYVCELSALKLLDFDVLVTEKDTNSLQLLS